MTTVDIGCLYIVMCSVGTGTVPVPYRYRLILFIDRMRRKKEGRKKVTLHNPFVVYATTPSTVR